MSMQAETEHVAGPLSVAACAFSNESTLGRVSAPVSGSSATSFAGSRDGCDIVRVRADEVRTHSASATHARYVTALAEAGR